MKTQKKVWIIVTQDGDLGEGPWDSKDDAERFLNAEVGVIAGLLEVFESSVEDLRRVKDLSFDIQVSPRDFRKHL